ncbi:MAG: ureidoglycolate hydrolase [Lachnospiraceae bacterium]|nr:ureidoglycolate hydrolase [Lachnospiraceae bacterium]
MITVKVQPLTVEDFAPYGSFTDVLHPTGNCLGNFYHDRVISPVTGNTPVAFSPMLLKKRPMIVSKAEYHNTTGECIIALDDDMIFHVAPPSKVPVPEKTKAFFVPQGTLVRVNVGVWHMGAFPVNKEEGHSLVLLPERTYMNDCTIVEYGEENSVEIVM